MLTEQQQQNEQTTIRITREQRHAVGILAAAEGVGVAEVVQDAVAEYLARPQHARVIAAVRTATAEKDGGR